MAQKFWHQLFEAGVFLKALNSLWETTAGLFVLTITYPVLLDWFVFFSFVEFGFISDRVDHLSLSTKNFVGFYLLFHGVINMFLAYNLFRNRLWAYPASMIIIGLFLTYQVYRLAHTHSLILLFLTLFDIAYLVLTWHEYNYQLKRKQHTQNHTA